MSTAYAFLTKKPNNTLIKFAEDLYDKYKFDIYIFVDDNNYTLDKSKKINFIQIDNDECLNNNIRFTQEPFLYNVIKNQGKIVNSWDKAVYYFAYLNIDYNYVWFIEDDVFIGSIDALNYIDNKYPKYDLLAATNNISKEEEVKNNVWYWYYAVEVFGFPSYCSMACACRLSKELLKLVKETSQQLGYVPYHEFSFNTLAMKNNLSVYCPKELSTILFEKDWSLNDFKENKNNLFHPVKCYDNHDIYRSLI